MKYLVCAAALAVSLATAQAGGAVELSKDNFDAKVAGKNAFVKFLAPASSIMRCLFVFALREVIQTPPLMQCRFIGLIPHLLLCHAAFTLSQHFVFF